MHQGLQGLRVLDLTSNVAGPFCTMTLGDLGADVVKIERPGRGDDARDWRPPEWNGYSTTFLSLNRNKRSIAIDLNSERGQAIVHELAREADVFVSSFRLDSMQKRRLDYETMRQINPRLIYCSITGFGSRGPESYRPGYDSILQARTGIMSFTGEEGRPPVRVGPSIVDIGTGLWSVIAILTALHLRGQTGEGQHIETSLFEVGMAWVSLQMMGYLGAGRLPRRQGSGTGMMAPYEAFATKDAYIMAAANNDQLFRRLCEALGVPELVEDERFKTNPLRVQNRDELHDLLEAVFKTNDALTWEKILVEAGVPCSRVQTLDQVAEDPQAHALGMFHTLQHPVLGEMKQVNLPFTLNRQRSLKHEAPPEVGQHTDEILAAIGYDAERIAALKADGVIA